METSPQGIHPLFFPLKRLKVGWFRFMCSAWRHAAEPWLAPKGKHSRSLILSKSSFFSQAYFLFTELWICLCSLFCVTKKPSSSNVWVCYLHLPQSLWTLKECNWVIKISDSGYWPIYFLQYLENSMVIFGVFWLLSETKQVSMHLIVSGNSSNHILFSGKASLWHFHFHLLWLTIPTLVQILLPSLDDDAVVCAASERK